MDRRKTRLDKVMSRQKASLTYEYGFGDSWEHDFLVERILPVQPHSGYPVCLAGKRACPPEDCAGICYYTNLPEIIRDPTHEKYAEMAKWLGGSFD